MPGPLLCHCHGLMWCDEVDVQHSLCDVLRVGWKYLRVNNCNTDENPPFLGWKKLLKLVILKCEIYPFILTEKKKHTCQWKKISFLIFKWMESIPCDWLHEGRLEWLTYNAYMPTRWNSACCGINIVILRNCQQKKIFGAWNINSQSSHWKHLIMVWNFHSISGWKTHPCNPHLWGGRYYPIDWWKTWWKFIC